MKTYKESVVESKVKKLVQRQCDLCGKTAKTENWDAACFDVDETEVKVSIRQKDGNSYPEGGSGYEFEIDLCPQCFKGRLVPWLLSQGATIAQKAWDW